MKDSLFQYAIVATLSLTAPGLALGQAVDSDRDGLTDEEEKSLKKKDGVKFDPTKTDSDGDHVHDALEALQADPKAIDVVLNEAGLDAVLIEHPFVLLEMSALWCAPSIGFAPHFLRAARSLTKKSPLRLAVHEASVNPAAMTPMSANLGITGFPTTLLIGSGRTVLGRIVGNIAFDNEPRLENFVAALGSALQDRRLTYSEIAEARGRSDMGQFLSINPAPFAGDLSDEGDEDRDGLSNADELALGTDPFDGDTDNDRLGDLEELELGTNPLARDSDGDGHSDHEELDEGSDPLDPTDPNLDSDADGLPDAHEREVGTDPFDADSDDDGFGDLEEVEQKTDPLDPSSTPL